MITNLWLSFCSYSYHRSFFFHFEKPEHLFFLDVKDQREIFIHQINIATNQSSLQFKGTFGCDSATNHSILLLYPEGAPPVWDEWGIKVWPINSHPQMLIETKHQLPMKSNAILRWHSIRSQLIWNPVEYSEKFYYSVMETGVYHPCHQSHDLFLDLQRFKILVSHACSMSHKF